MLEAAAALVVEHAELEDQLADPGVHADPGLARRLGRRYSELTPVVAAYQEWTTAQADVGAAAELARDDASFREELPALEQVRDEAAERLRRLLVP
ncbi:MAG TPA: PCRF domain-containing protein, partial [Actinomycetales bacterium]